MASDRLKERTLKGMIWCGLETVSVSGTNFIFSIILARILMPEDFGIIAIMSVFMLVAQVFIDSGFSNALIRKQDRTETDNSTTFWFNIIIGIIAYLTLFFSAPAIARFYETPSLVAITRIYGITLIINSLAVVQRALISASLNFKFLMKVSFAGSLTSCIVALIAALSGCGVWALVILNIGNVLISTALIWIFNKWRPKLIFSRKSFSELFGFGSKLLLSGLLDTLYNNAFSLIIGKQFSTAQLGYYVKSDNISGSVARSCTSIIQRVTYPSMSSIQDQTERLRNSYRKIIRLSAYVIFPMMLSIAAIADPLVRLLLTDKWAFAIPLLQILCISYMWYPIHAINLNLLQVKGRSDLFLKLEIIKKIVGIAIICIAIPFGVIGLCLGRLASSLIALIINTHYTGKLIDVGFFRQMTDLMPCLLNSAIMAGICLAIQYICSSLILKIIFALIVGIIYYLCSNYIIRSTEQTEIFQLIRNRKNG